MIRLTAVVLCLAALAASDTFFDIDLSSVTRPPLWEPSAEEYFPTIRDGVRDANGLPSPVVLEKPTHEEFLSHARKGYPILVSSWADGMQYLGWSGKEFAKEFPFGYMKAEYIHELKGFNPRKHDMKQIDGEQRFNIGSFKPNEKTMWYNFSRPASSRYADDPLKPKGGPYVWHVKDELTPKQKKLVQARFESPDFLQDPLNKEFMNRTFEIWFSPGKEVGAGAHNDGYCQSVVSFQLRGDKRWRKQIQPKMTFLDSFDEFDGGVYQAGRWAPDLGFVNKEGSAVIWPPGYLHETSTLGSTNGDCGAAVTLQYAFPQPVQYLRAFLPRLSLSSEVGQCVAMSWTGYATFHIPGMKPTAKGDLIKEQLKAILAKVDSDGDQTITVKETRDWLAQGSSTAEGESHQFDRSHRQLFLDFKAADTAAYHDMDNDMAVSKQELWDSLVQWNVVRIRMQEGLKLVNNADREGLEGFERSLDHMRREPAQFPKKLRPELEDLFSLPKGTKIFSKKDMKRVVSFSDSEFFSEARELVERQMAKRGIRSHSRDAEL